MAKALRLTKAGEEIDRLTAEIELLKGLVLKLSVAAVDPGEFTDADDYVAEVFGFVETGSDAEPATEAEIDELTSIMVSEYDFTDEDDDEDEKEDGKDG